MFFSEEHTGIIRNTGSDCRATKETAANLGHRKDSDFTNQGCVPESRVGKWNHISMLTSNTFKIYGKNL